MDDIAMIACIESPLALMNLKEVTSSTPHRACCG